MTTIELKGGLGNQMFQYAYGRKLEIFGGKIIFDISFFRLDTSKITTARNFKLNNFNIGTKPQFSNRQSRFHIFFTKIKRKFGFKIEEYFQSEKYFKGIEETIKKEFTLKNPLTEYTQVVFDKIKNVPISVSLHIRRGDYVKDIKTNAYHGVCSLEYYQKAYEELTKKLNSSFEIFVFSDDIEWVKENLKLLPVQVSEIAESLSSPVQMHFVSNPNIPDYEEIFLMSCCKHNIIANSSFSWWGAWLNPNKEKIIIAPEKWFANKKEDSRDIVPQTWIKI